MGISNDWTEANIPLRITHYCVIESWSRYSTMEEEIFPQDFLEVLHIEHVWSRSENASMLRKHWRILNEPRMLTADTTWIIGSTDSGGTISMQTVQHYDKCSARWCDGCSRNKVLRMKIFFCDKRLKLPSRQECLLSVSLRAKLAFCNYIWSWHPLFSPCTEIW